MPLVASFLRCGAQYDWYGHKLRPNRTHLLGLYPGENPKLYGAYSVFQTRLSEYTALTHALVNFTTRKEGAYMRKWSGELSPMAQKFLEHYAVLNDINSLQQTCM